MLWFYHYFFYIFPYLPHLEVMANEACLDFAERQYSKALAGFQAALQRLSMLKHPHEEIAQALERNKHRAAERELLKGKGVAAKGDEHDGLEFFIMI